MPVYFRFYRKSDPKKESVPFSVIDQEICNHFKALCDDTKYYFNWYDTITNFLVDGVELSNIEKKLLTILEKYKDDKIWKEFLEKSIDICKWINEHFYAECWYDRRKPENE